ncbi:uncharacterized protein JCM10292_000084 [Rhodotorula paludigena]|uniref:uncharacterized protein n=1 Tax=Rhodotorula paludigena TaxID=86838 RepID=UPI003172F98E
MAPEEKRIEPVDAQATPAEPPTASPVLRLRRWVHMLRPLPLGSAFMAALTLLALLHGAALLLFSRGLLLTRKALPDINDCSPVSPSGNLDPSCTLPATHGKLVFVVFDALRAAGRALQAGEPRRLWTRLRDKRRESRGLTSAGKQNRGLGKGHRFNKARQYATWKKHNTLSLRRYR